MPAFCTSGSAQGDRTPRGAPRGAALLHAQSQERELLELGRRARRQAETEVGGAGAEVLGFPPEIRIVEGYASDVVLEASEDGGSTSSSSARTGRRGPSRLWLGSLRDRVPRASAVPVLLVRDGAPPSGMKRIFCPVAVGEASQAALDHAVSMAEAFGAELHVLRAVSDEKGRLPDCPGVTQEMRRRCTVVERTVHGNVVAAYLAGARETKADVVVVGSEHPDSVLGELFSTTNDQILRKLAAL